MKDFIHNLYSNPNFALYLGIVIIVLLVAFVIVYFLGKKDKEKLEKTKRLETITNDAFSEVSVPVSPDVTPVKEVESQVEIVETPNVMPAEEAFVQADQDASVVVTPNVASTPIEARPEVATIIPDIIKLPNEESEEILPSKTNYTEITESIDRDLKAMEQQVAKPLLNEKVEPSISMPTQQAVIQPSHAEVKRETSNNQVFSSVYAPRKDSVMFDDTSEIELPKLR